MKLYQKVTNEWTGCGYMMEALEEAKYRITNK